MTGFDLTDATKIVDQIIPCSDSLEPVGLPDVVAWHFVRYLPIMYDSATQLGATVPRPDSQDVVYWYADGGSGAQRTLAWQPSLVVIPNGYELTQIARYNIDDEGFPDPGTFNTVVTDPAQHWVYTPVTTPAGYRGGRAVFLTPAGYLALSGPVSYTHLTLPTKA